MRVLSSIDQRGRYRFVLETNGVLLGADASYCRDLAAFDCLHVRVSLKGSCETEFALLTGSRQEGFGLQVDALRNLHEAGVSCHPAVMSSFSTDKALAQLRKRIAAIDPELLADLELEELIRYPRVERRLRSYGLAPRISHDPKNVPEHLV
jgi:uncharacterized Fe-S cluster-containing radical SAM superfamily protein